jgi:dephospho-CoA kinase
MPFTVFDADACVHELLASDAEVITAVRQAFLLPTASPLDRTTLRQIVFTAPEERRRLEQIVHPVVHSRWQQLRSACATDGRNFLADIPLLFETGAEAAFDATILVAASPETQRRRLADRGLPPGLIEGMLASQWTIGQKVPLADHVIWNDGSLAELEQQSSLLLAQLFPRAA